MNYVNNKGDETEEAAAWLPTYADLVTLLFTFFVLLFAISNVDAQKFALIAAAFSKEGVTPEVFEQIAVMYPSLDELDPNDPKVNVNLPGTTTTAPDPQDTTTPGSQVGDVLPIGPLNDLHSYLSEYVVNNGMENSVSVEFVGEEIQMTLKNDLWFQSGSATVTPDMVENAKMIAAILRDNQDPDDPFSIIVEGHTDNVPLKAGGAYLDNWDLSADRAVSFLRILIKESQLDPVYFSSRALGEDHPVADNSTDEGRQQNRRVEIRISYSIPRT